jgi:hypothetical protein
MVCVGWRGHREHHRMMAQGGMCDKNYFANRRAAELSL